MSWRWLMTGVVVMTFAGCAPTEPEEEVSADEAFLTATTPSSLRGFV